MEHTYTYTYVLYSRMVISDFWARFCVADSGPLLAINNNACVCTKENAAQ